MSSDRPRRRVAIIGAGMVGSAFAYALTIMGTARELALIDQNVEKAKGEAMDLSHGSALLRPVSIEAGGYELCRDAEVVVITAGAPQREGQTRLDLAQQNAGIMRDIVPQILEHNPDPILLVVANPMDVLTKVALETSGLPRNQVFGSGTVLDSARFRALLADQCGLDPRNVHTRVMGEHGDSEVLVWSQVNLAGLPLKEYCGACQRECSVDAHARIEKEVTGAAYEVISRKGSTYYGIGLALVRIVEAVLRDQHSLLTVSTLAPDGMSGLEGVCLALPCVVGANGVEKVLQPHLSDDETKRLQQSANILRQSLQSVDAL